MNYCFAIISILLLLGCKTTTIDSQTKDIADAKVITQRSDGNFDVFCKDGTNEVRSRNELLSNNVCEANSQSQIIQRCECVDNNGPDLVQIGFNPSTGQELWKSKLEGWDKGSGNYAKCYQKLREELLCRPKAMPPTIVSHCECVENNGPDLHYKAQKAETGEVLWETKINGWDSKSGASEACAQSISSEPLCQQSNFSHVYRRCECIDNNGPDLIQFGYNPVTDKEIWKTRLFGWNTGSDSFSKCWTRLGEDPQCRSNSTTSDITTHCECIENDGPDLRQIGIRLRDAKTLWTVKLFGWDSTSDAYEKCRQALRSHPLCRQ